MASRRTNFEPDDIPIESSNVGIPTSNSARAKYARDEKTINSWLSSLPDDDLNALKNSDPELHQRGMRLKAQAAERQAEQLRMRQEASSRKSSAQVAGTSSTRPRQSPEEIAELYGARAAARAKIKAEAKKASIADLRNRYKSTKDTNPIAKAYNWAANKAIDSGAETKEGVRGRVLGTIGTTAAVAGLGLAAIKNYRRFKDEQRMTDEQEKYANELIERRNNLIAQRRGEPTSTSTDAALYAKYAETVEFGFGIRSPIKLQNPFVTPEPKGLPLKEIGLTALAGYGLLSGLRQKRDADEIAASKIKDKLKRKQAESYLNSPLYHIDSVLSSTAGKYLPSNTISLSNSDSNTANFILPLAVASAAVGLGGGIYGLYRRKVEAKKKDEVLEAEKLAALDRIKDSELRSALIQEARGQTIDDESRSKLVDAALGGDVKGALSIGLKKIRL